MRCRVAMLFIAVASLLTAVGVAPAAAEPGPYDTSKAFYADHTTYGWIPDDSPTCGTAGTPLEVEFDVADLPAKRITGIYVRFTVHHSSIGDVDASLVAPDGTEHVLFADTGGRCIDAARPHLHGSYGFIDTAERDWWAEAAALGEDEAMDPDPYRTSDASGAQTSMVEGFADVVDPNGTWVLRVSDDWNGVRGNVTAAELGISVDTTTPDIVVSGPAYGATVTGQPTYEFSSTHGDVEEFRCRIDDGPEVPCTSPWTPALRNGGHRVTMAAVDTSGNVAPVTYAVIVNDQVPPDTVVTGGPPDQAVVTEPPTWELGSPDPDVLSYLCSLDAGAWQPCTSPYTPTSPDGGPLAPGPHLWGVAAIDVNGNGDPTPVVRTFTLRDLACEDAQATLQTAERKLQRAEASGDRARIRKAKRAVRRAERAVATECADVPARQGAR